MTQKDKVLKYLQTHKGITQRKAFTMGIYRLSAVIFDLKQDFALDDTCNSRIITEMKKVKNADGTYSMIADYHLVE